MKTSPIGSTRDSTPQMSRPELRRHGSGGSASQGSPSYQGMQPPMKMSPVEYSRGGSASLPPNQTPSPNTNFPVTESIQKLVGSLETPSVGYGLEDQMISPFMTPSVMGTKSGFTPRALTGGNTPVWSVDDAKLLEQSFAAGFAAGAQKAQEAAALRGTPLQSYQGIEVKSQPSAQKYGAYEHSLQAPKEGTDASSKDAATPYFMATSPHEPTNTASIVTGSGPTRTRVRAESLHSAVVLNKRVLATPSSGGSTRKKDDLSLHHIDSIKAPLDCGSPVLP